ncbi:biotin synthase auxiliary protein BsaP [Aciditerrimonas ferrireducens]|uniref:biotin synthase auxiliary protein BsaP n=1 Tax=Aciditerrimonas ferrireducens TaxID=667306 RepID=UPI00406A0A46
MAPEPGPGDGGASHCPGCGRPLAPGPGGADAGHCPGCLPPLDPPRFCPACGRRLRVLVSPRGWRATCRTHGPLGPDF